MNPTTTDGVDIRDRPDRLPTGRTRRRTLGQWTALGRELGKRRREPVRGVRQVIVDSGLTWRPALRGTGLCSLDLETPSGARCSGAGRECPTFLSNAGGSPAIAATYLTWRRSRGFFMSTPVDVPAHGARAELIGATAVDEAVGRRVLHSIGATEPLAGAIFCRDFLDRRWCFPVSVFEPEHTALEAIVWRKGAHAPAWASSPRLWGPQPVRGRSRAVDPGEHAVSLP